MKIGTVTSKFGISHRALHYWENAGILKSIRAENDYRYYDEENLRKIKQIVLLRKLRLPIPSIQEIFTSEEFSKVITVFGNHMDETKREADQLNALGTILRELLNMLKDKQKRMALSFELFPPKTDTGMEKLCSENGIISKLCTLNPDYISVTYGAGGGNATKNIEVLDAIKAKSGAVPITHYTCIGNTKEKIKAELQNYLDHGIDHILALRGDLPHGWTGTGGDLRYATELVKFIRDEFGDKFCIAVAGSPEGHITCRSLEADIGFLKQKQDEGADFIMTQLCWDMDQFRYWMDAIRAAGITMPVDVGIMPVIDISAVVNMSLSRNGCAIPRELAEIISKNWIFPTPFAPADDMAAQKKADFKEAGIEYTIKLIDEYRVCGIAGIHLYALNQYDDIARIVNDSGIKDII